MRAITGYATVKYARQHSVRPFLLKCEREPIGAQGSPDEEKPREAPEASSWLRTALLSGVRGPGRPFPQGKSPNPGGRPKALRHVREAARQHTELAIEALAATLDAVTENGLPDHRTRIQAAGMLMDRAYGRPGPMDSEHVETSIRLPVIMIPPESDE